MPDDKRHGGYTVSEMSAFREAPFAIELRYQDKVSFDTHAEFLLYNGPTTLPTVIVWRDWRTYTAGSAAAKRFANWLHAWPRRTD